MKSFLTNGMAILLLMAGSYILFLRECRSSGTIGKNEMIIKKAVWDSIQKIKNKPPIIKIDTFRIVGKPVYVTSKPLPTPIPTKDSSITEYKDSLINAEISVWLNDKVKGVLVGRSWKYKPISTKIIENKTVFVPQIVNNEVPVSKAGIFVYGIVGRNATVFIPGAGVDLITKKNTVLGVIYQRDGSANVFSVKLGFKLGK